MPDDTDAAGGPPAVRLCHYADLEAAYDDPARIGALAGRLERLRGDDALVVGAGDDTALGVLALLTDSGRAQARPLFEAVSPAADTFGNHDFDYGREWAFEWAESVPATYLCANLDGPGADRVPDATVVECAGGTDRGSRAGATGGTDRELRAGAADGTSRETGDRASVRVGLAGVAHPNTADLGGAVEDLRFTDPVAAASDAFADLPPVDYRVVVSHCGAGDREIAASVDADAVLGGHLHERHVERVGGTLVVRTAGGGAELSEVRLGGEPSVEFHEIDPDADGSPTDDDLAETYRERRAALGLDEVVARVDDPVARTERERFGGESRAGNFAADAFRAAADAEVGLFPAGALRTGPPLSGDVTVGDLAACCPFDGRVLEVELDGDEFARVLADAAHPHPGDRGWVQFHVGGARVVWTDDNEVAEATVGDEPVDPDRTYRVATSEYVAGIDDFGPIDRAAVVAEHAPQWRALVDHARDGGLDVGLDGRIRRVPA
ncbi:5'-nucleotidase C-terminal domain-containing protein [Halosimplex marinum]|uniref:5'-nucleotidase C-terminal domain-containing protein n=1 Tax=Halosimplex marinum TaxID=3396620 RepID=UPI003F556EC9